MGKGETRVVRTVEGLTTRMQSKDESREKPCLCCNGEPHIFAYGVDLLDVKRWYNDSAQDINEWIGGALREFRFRPGTRVRITVEEVEEVTPRESEGLRMLTTLVDQLRTEDADSSEIALGVAEEIALEIQRAVDLGDYGEAPQIEDGHMAALYIRRNFCGEDVYVVPRGAKVVKP